MEILPSHYHVSSGPISTEGSSSVFPAHHSWQQGPWQGGFLSLLSLLELMSICRGILRQNYTVCGARARGLKGHRDSPSCPLYCLPPRHYK